MYKGSIRCLVWLIVIIGNTAQLLAQQTVGIFQNKPEAEKGYVLMAPLQDTATYLLNNCGELVHVWRSHYKPGLSAYLLPDGSLLRAAQVPNPVFSGQAGGRVERFNWEGALTWSYVYSSPLFHQHHDICPLPNGNVLLLAFAYKSQAEALAAGRKFNTAIWPEHIIEVEPLGADSGKIIWEWHAWDHTIQEWDSTAPNYGQVAAHPELLHLNYPPTGGNGNNPADWLHGNGLDYNPVLDQIILSSRSFSEFFIIDHSTTTAEAASHTGGKYGRGGDILYRWGNPAAYNRGDSTTQQLFYQHHAQWTPNGSILVFNNGSQRPDGNYSTVDELMPDADSAGFYTWPQNGSFGPALAFWKYEGTPRDSFYSAFIGGTQRLNNGNTLICEGMSGHLMEVDAAGNLVWEYVNPVTNSGIVSQGTPPVSNLVFRAYKYELNAPAFKDKVLTPSGYLELNPGNYNCQLFTSSDQEIAVPEQERPQVFPNPVLEEVQIHFPEVLSWNLQVKDISGSTLLELRDMGPAPLRLSVADWSPGVYYLLFQSVQHQAYHVIRVIKQ